MQQIRASAQGLIALLTYGVGMAIGTYVAGLIVAANTTTTGYDWNTIWLIPGGFAALVAILFMISFRDESADEEMSEEGRDLLRSLAATSGVAGCCFARSNACEHVGHISISSAFVFPFLTASGTTWYHPSSPS